MGKFKIGDEVECIADGRKGNGHALGRKFVIIDMTYEIAWGPIGGVYMESLKLVNDKNMKELDPMMKLLVDADTQALLETGIIDTCFNFTSKGKSLVDSMVLAQFKDALVKIAQDEIAAAKK